MPDTAYKTSTPAATIKDVLDYVPGVFVQPKWGDDTRLSIRGSGLSRNFHLRGVQLYMDGIPINTADGFGDFQEIDPTAYRYVEVYKGANALRLRRQLARRRHQFRDADGLRRRACSARASTSAASASTSCSRAPAASTGRSTIFITGSWQEHDGFRDHSWGEATRGQRQPRLPALARRRDALLLQRQLTSASASRAA